MNKPDFNDAQITDLRYSTEEDPFAEAVKSQANRTRTSSLKQSSNSKNLITTVDGSNLLAVPLQRKSSNSNQVNIKTNYIENDDISGTAEISDFVVETDLCRNNLITSSSTKKSKKLIKKVLSMSEQVDEFIDQCIEIESNKKMFQDNVNWFLLTFHSHESETMV